MGKPTNSSRRRPWFRLILFSVLALLCTAFWVRGAYFTCDTVSYAKVPATGQQGEARLWAIDSGGGRFFIRYMSAPFPGITAQGATQWPFPPIVLPFIQQYEGFKIEHMDASMVPPRMDPNDVSFLAVLGFEHAATNDYGDVSKIWAFPAWVLVLPLWLVALLTTRKAVRVRAARQKGRCLQCGYDLRASPERCPECGALNDQGNVSSPHELEENQ